MTRIAKTFTASLLALVAAFPALAAAKSNPSVEKPLKLVIGYVRQGKDDKALQQLAVEAQSKALLGDQWGKMTADQRKEFMELFQSLFARLAFPKFRDNFQHLAAINYSNAVVKGGDATADALIVIDHPVEKQELKLEFELTREKGSFKIVDVTVLGGSMLKDIREQQIQMIMKKGGDDPVGHLLNVMRERNKELSAKAG